MPRQPSPTPFNQRESHVRETKKSYYMIFEGRTEKDYFSRLLDSKLLIDNLYLCMIAKKGIEQDMSDRMEMVKSAYDFMLFRHTGLSTLRRYITLVLSDFYSQMKGSLDIRPYELRKELLSFRDELIELYHDHYSVSDGLVEPVSDLHRAISNKLSNKYGVNYSMGDTDAFTASKRPVEKNERVFVVFDRDYSEQYFNHQMYSDCIDKCDELGYAPVVSSPKFELWMLMHHKSPNFGKPSFYPSYGSHISSELVVCGDLSAIPGCPQEKYIDQERFDDFYRDGILDAIERSKDTSLFCTGPRTLMDHPGTDMGLLIDEIVNRSRIGSFAD